MRVLFSCLPGYGHFNPLVPLARALARSRHEVVFVTANSFTQRIQQAGFDAFPAGMAFDEQIAEARRAYPHEAELPPGKRRFLLFVPKMLAGVAAPSKVNELVRIVGDWRPDIIVHDVADFSAPIAAQVYNVPYVDHGVGVLRPLEMARIANQILAPLSDEWDVDLDPFGGLYRYLYLDVCPPSLQSTEIREVPVVQPMRNTQDLDTGGHGALPAWVGDLPALPTVYVTLGTIFNRSPLVIEAVLAGLQHEQLNIIVTVGYDSDPTAFGGGSSNVWAEHYIPLSLLLPYLDVAVTQGGTSILPILGHGLPLLVLPQGADQFHHADACVGCGAGRSLCPDEVTPDAVLSEVRLLLEAREYRQSAQDVQAEIEAMPKPEEVVRQLECLAFGQDPTQQLSR